MLGPSLVKHFDGQTWQRGPFAVYRTRQTLTFGVERPFLAELCFQVSGGRLSIGFIAGRKMKAAG